MKYSLHMQGVGLPDLLHATLAGSRSHHHLCVQMCLGVCVSMCAVQAHDHLCVRWGYQMEDGAGVCVLDRGIMRGRWGWGVGGGVVSETPDGRISLLLSPSLINFSPDWLRLLINKT